MKMRKVMMVLIVAVAVGMTGCKFGPASSSDPSASGEEIVESTSTIEETVKEPVTWGTDPLSEFMRERPVPTYFEDPGFRGESRDDDYDPIEDLQPRVLVIGEDEVIIDWDEDSPILA